MCDGEPLGGASMMFYPVDGNGQTSHAFTDAAGRYRARVVATKLAVTVSLFESVGTDARGEPLLEQALHPRYSDCSQTQLTALPEAGKTTVCDFALTGLRRKTEGVRETSVNAP